MLTQAAPHVAVSGIVHFALLLYAATAPRFAPTRAEQIEDMRPYLIALEAKSRVESITVARDLGGDEGRVVNDDEGNGVAGGGDRRAESEGRAGTVLSRAPERRRWSAPRRKPVESEAWDGLSLGANEFGMIGLLARQGTLPVRESGEGASSFPADEIAAQGSMWGRVLGESPGTGGVGITGTGLGGGGSGRGVGLDAIGDFGHAAGAPGNGTGGRGSPANVVTGFGVGWGEIWTTSHCGIGTGHTAQVPTYARDCGYPMVSGRLPPEAIQRAVRANFGRFRLCYEQGLARNASLAGRISTRFVIGGDGHVVSSENAGSDLPDAKVAACVAEGFARVVFPEVPERQSVTVVYPILFAPE